MFPPSLIIRRVGRHEFYMEVEQAELTPEQLTTLAAIIKTLPYTDGKEVYYFGTMLNLLVEKSA